MFGIEMFDCLTVNQKLCSYAKVNCLKFSETISLCAKNELRLI